MTEQDFQAGMLLLEVIKSNQDSKSVCLDGEIYGTGKQEEIHV